MAKKKAVSTDSISIQPQGPISVLCMPLIQGKHQMYVFVIKAKLLWSVVKVNRRQEDKDEGYQRAFSESRVQKIARYLDQGNCIPGAILIAFDKDHVKATKDLLTFDGDPDSGWVIDGQHRLIGAHRAGVDVDVLVVAVLGQSLEEQVGLFVTINREQKGVPTSLYYDLLKLLPRQLSEAEALQERAQDLVDSLRKDEDSPFFRRIKITTSPKSGQLSSTNVIRKVTPLIKKDGRLSEYTDAERAAIINNLYRAIEIEFPDEYGRTDSVFFRTIGFGAIMNSLPTLIQTTFRITGKNTFRVDDVSKTLRLISDFDFRSWGKTGTGTAAENAASEDLRLRLDDEGKAKSSQGIEL